MVPGTGLEPASREAADFRHTTSFDADAARYAQRRSCAGLCLRHRDAHDHLARIAALGAPRLVSTPSAKQPCGIIFGLGSALPRLDCRACAGTGARGFTEFEGFCTNRFRLGTQLLKSAMFTNFITRAGRTRFYHRSHRIPPARGRQEWDWRMAERVLG